MKVMAIVSNTGSAHAFSLDVALDERDQEGFVHQGTYPT